MKRAAYILMLALASFVAAAAEIGPAVQTGTASWYGVESSKKTATGEHYDPQAMTAAHRTLPMGTMIQVRNLNNGCCATLRVTDRGPCSKGRILDVSKAAARQLDMLRSGTAKVQIAIVR
jgi:rare lipoprotein A